MAPPLPGLDVFKNKAQHALPIVRPPADLAGKVHYLRTMVVGLLENGYAEVKLCNRQGEVVHGATFLVPFAELIAGPVVKMEMEGKG